MMHKPDGRAGTGNGNHRLTEEQAVSIYLSQDKLVVLAALHGVGTTAVSDIINRKTWRHATEGLARPPRRDHRLRGSK